eukprot:GHVS01026865.1.p1 GENE.GHVS01026865.1~~GHVS01026865.1.p1  ORF type:complete len:140 (-),score=17.08 GHVS01026865.1:100-519(-)
MNRWRKSCLLIHRRGLNDDIKLSEKEEKTQYSMEKFLPLWKEAADAINVVNEYEASPTSRSKSKNSSKEKDREEQGRPLSPSVPVISCASVAVPIFIPAYKEEYIPLCFGGKKLIRVQENKLMLLGLDGMSIVPGRLLP